MVVSRVSRARGGEARPGAAGRSREPRSAPVRPRSRGRGGVRPARGQCLIAVTLGLACLGLAGCGLDENLPENPLQVIAQPGPLRVLLPNGDLVERRHLVDGDATDAEWATVPYQYLAMGPENGNGGGSYLASLKVAHDSTRIYLLVQWPDDAPENLGPRLVFAPNRGLDPDDCDSLLVTCSWRLEDPDEDRMAIMWDLRDAADGSGTFKERGCQVACHGSMHPLSGAVDIWQWRAARTNSIQYPLPGSNVRVGFAEDGYADASSRVLDPGDPFYRDNYRWVDCPADGRAPVPLEIPVGLDVNGQPTTRTNDNMQPCQYIYDPSGFSFSACSRNNPCRQFNQEDVETWVSGDDLAAFLTNRPVSETQRRSLHDVEARGRFVEQVQGTLERGVWTVELSRSLQTGRAEDLDFVRGRPEPYHMALAIMNHDSRIHSGSPVVQITIQP